MTALFDVLGYVALIFLGLILRLTGAVPKEAIRPLTMLLLYVTLPAVILRALVGTEFRPEYVGIFLLGLGGNWLMIGLARFLTRKHTHKDWQFAGLNLPGYNIGIFAMPFTSGFLPPEGFLALCLFDAGNSVMCTGGTYALVCREKSGRRDGGPPGSTLEAFPPPGRHLPERRLRRRTEPRRQRGRRTCGGALRTPSRFSYVCVRLTPPATGRRSAPGRPRSRKGTTPERSSRESR